MATVELEDGEWQVVITALAMSNPLVVKIAQQLQEHAARAQRLATVPGSPRARDGHDTDISGFRTP